MKPLDSHVFFKIYLTQTQWIIRKNAAKASFVKRNKSSADCTGPVVDSAVAQFA